MKYANGDVYSDIPVLLSVLPHAAVHVSVGVLHGTLAVALAVLHVPMVETIFAFGAVRYLTRVNRPHALAAAGPQGRLQVVLVESLVDLHRLVTAVLVGVLGRPELRC